MAWHLVSDLVWVWEVQNFQEYGIKDDQLEAVQAEDNGEWRQRNKGELDFYDWPDLVQTMK